MRILLLSHVVNNAEAGASRVYHMLTDNWRAKGHHVDLLHLEDFKIPPERRTNLLVRRTLLPQWIAVQTRRKVKVASYDVIMASSGHGYALYKSLRRGQRRPLLVNHFHGLTLYDDLAAQSESFLGFWKASVVSKIVTGPVQNRWDTAGARYADVTIVQNMRDLSHVERLLTPDKAVPIIPAAVHPTLIAESETVRPSADRRRGHLLWFGTWEPRKAAAHVPAAFRAIRAQYPDTTLTLGGTSRTEEEIRGWFLPDDHSHLIVLPRISVADQVALFNDASIFLFPSLSEGFGLALLEAMCFECAAVTTNTGFGGDYMIDGVHGRVVYPSSRHIARAVVDLIEDTSRRAALARRGRALARSFTAERMADAYLSVFTESGRSSDA
jgi:glycosyltransferase involved in cell wall biosynthesis